VLLAQVYPLRLILCLDILSLVLCRENERARPLRNDGRSNADRMQPVYSRIHLLSIYDPATIHDFPFKILENCLKYLNHLDLVAPTLACRAWYPAATGLFYCHFNLVKKDRERVERFICGLRLRSIVFGAGSCKIKLFLLLFPR
jgi:hypothetical protein